MADTRGKPMDLRVLDGTFREDRHGPLDDQVQAQGVPVMPQGLTADIQEQWEVLVRPLIDLGIVRAVDATELADMCRWRALYLKHQKALAKITPAAKHFRTLVYAAGMFWTKFDSIAQRFGMTPVDRNQLRVEGKKKEGVVARKREVGA